MVKVQGLDQDIKSLGLSDKVVKKLHQLNIEKIEELWNCKRTYLKENKMSDSEIYQIKVKLQLRSLDLNKKIYSNN